MDLTRPGIIQLPVGEAARCALPAGAAVISHNAAAHISLLRSTVAEELALGLEHRGHAPAHMEREIAKTAAALGLTQLLDRDPARLSGGQTRRLAIATVAITRPAVMVLYEPLAGLDPLSQRQVIAYIRSLPTTCTVVFSHRFDPRWQSLPAGEHVGFPQACSPSTSPIPASEARGYTLPRPVEPGPELARLTVSPRPRNAPATGLRRWLRLRPNREDLQASAAVQIPTTTLVCRRSAAVWLQGDNGAGKTTILRAAAGLDGNRPGDWPRISLALQSPEDQVIDATVNKFVGDPALVRELGLEGEAHPLDLSGSQLRLAQVAAVIHQGRELIALDEPDTLIAGAQRGALHQLIATAARRGAGLIITCHDPQFMAEVAAYLHLTQVRVGASTDTKTGAGEGTGAK